MRVIVYITEGEEEADGPEEGGALPDPEEAFLEVGDLGEGASAQADDAVGEDPVGQKASSQGRETEARGVPGSSRRMAALEVPESIQKNYFEEHFGGKTCRAHQTASMVLSWVFLCSLGFRGTLRGILRFTSARKKRRIEKLCTI